MTTTIRRETKAERVARFFETFARLGFTYDETEQLRRIERTLSRWSELECGDGNDYASWSIERDETTGKPFRCVYPHTGKSYRTPIADREKGALTRLRKIIAARNARAYVNGICENPATAYHQGDPRGCALYVVTLADYPPQIVAEWRAANPGANPSQFPFPQLDSLYTNGCAVCAD